MIKDIKDKLTNAIASANVFKEIHTGYVPPPSKINKFPAIAIDFVKTKFDRATGCTLTADSIVHTFIYNRRPKSNTASIDIDNLITDVDRAIQTDTDLQVAVTDVLITEILSDGGITLPTEVYRVTIGISYRTTARY